LTDAQSTFRVIYPPELPPHVAYQTLLHCVAPRPIAFTSTISKDGLPNLAPFSYFMAGGANPCSVVISPTTTRTGEHKDTLKNIEATGEYVINVVTFAMRDKMNLASAPYPYGVSEWEKAGFTAVNSICVKPARVMESPLALECKLFKIVPHGDGPLCANYVIGEVVCIHISEELLDEDGVIDARRIDYIARMGGDWYSRVTAESMFELDRPK
jgi:flavin reductase (DIM6/NTAB) family NADH-FMN oxidoreductase RutF